jgi:hypothetical protein
LGKPKVTRCQRGHGPNCQRADVASRVVVDGDDVEQIGLGLPEAQRGNAHEGSPALVVRGVQFARLRLDDQAAVLQFWVPEADLVASYVEEDPAVFRSATGYSRKVVMARLDALDTATLREALVQSWSARAPARLRREHDDLR